MVRQAHNSLRIVFEIGAEVAAVRQIGYVVLACMCARARMGARVRPVKWVHLFARVCLVRLPGGRLCESNQIRKEEQAIARPS